MLQPVLAAGRSMVEIAPPSSELVRQFTNNGGGARLLSHEEKLKLLQNRIKYVFVLFQENRSFDHYFGTYPSATGLYSQPARQTPGLVQPIMNTDGSVTMISPFLIPQTVKTVTTPPQTVPIYPMDTASVDHSHTGINNSLDVSGGIAQNDRYALNAEGLTTTNAGPFSPSNPPRVVSLKTGLPVTSVTLAQKQKAELTISHVDCDTVPFLWQYADRFTLFDDFNQTIIGPSTPNAIAMVAGQSGETQWVLHPGEASSNTADPGVAISGGEPVVGDNGPFPGSNFDTSTPKPPYGLMDESPATPAFNQTYASLPLSFMGKNIRNTIRFDKNPAVDLLDVEEDINVIASQKAVNWAWYQEGFGPEPTDSTATPTGFNYIVHHNGPQYFGYVGDNPKVAANLHSLSNFFTDISDKNLPKDGGVIYVRGGYGNNDGLKPVDPNPALAGVFPGNDDHPGYSDAQISEALVADEVNAIAASPYWKDSVIIITYDETDGLYDHQSPAFRSLDPEGNPLSGGPRIPAIVISPYSIAHGISHERSEHSSVIKFIDELFNLTPLADLPDEAKARRLGRDNLGQADLGPADDVVPNVSDLFSAFDDARLTGQVQPLPASYAEIPANLVKSLPHYGGQGCFTLNIVPTDYVPGKGLIDPAPADFNPRPSTNPGTPTAGNWTP
jgi:phospholipase C